MKYLFIFFFLIVFQTSYSQVFEMDTLLWSGPSENRINLVLLGDGYHSNELDQYIVDSQKFVDALFNESPYQEYQNYFNVVAIKVSSNESGASHPGTASDVSEPQHPISMIDNYFGSTFDSYGIHRLLTANNTFAIANVLAANFPTYDQAFIMVNSPYYGGSGGKYPVASVNESSAEIAIHELGHSFVKLNDEYYAGNVFASEAINMTQIIDTNDVKWRNWIGLNGVGIYQHCCSGNASNWYRPHESCKMRYLGTSFCSVCKEGTIEKIHSLVNSIDSFSPNNIDIIQFENTMNFDLVLVEPFPNTLNIEWQLNGIDINSDSTSVSISENELIQGLNQIQATVTDNTNQLMVDQHETLHFTSIIWNITNSSTGVNEIIQNNLRITYFPNPATNTINITLINTNQESFIFEIYDIKGTRVLKKNYEFNVQDFKVQIEHFSQGTYFTCLTFASGLNISKKIIKE